MITAFYDLLTHEERKYFKATNLLILSKFVLYLSSHQDVQMGEKMDSVEQKWSDWEVWKSSIFSKLSKVHVS